MRDPFPGEVARDDHHDDGVEEEHRQHLADRPSGFGIVAVESPNLLRSKFRFSDGGGMAAVLRHGICPILLSRIFWLPCLERSPNARPAQTRTDDGKEFARGECLQCGREFHGRKWNRNESHRESEPSPLLEGFGVSKVLRTFARHQHLVDFVGSCRVIGDRLCLGTADFGHDYRA